MTGADVLKALSSQTVEIVLTAHPTEVNRRTTIQVHHRIEELLAKLSTPDMSTRYELRQYEEQLTREINLLYDVYFVCMVNDKTNSNVYHLGGLHKN